MNIYLSEIKATYYYSSYNDLMYNIALKTKYVIIKIKVAYSSIQFVDPGKKGGPGTSTINYIWFNVV